MKKHRQIIILLISIGILIRILFAWNRLLWLDEVQTVEYVRRGLLFILNLGNAENLDIHPPLYYILLWAWSRISDSDLFLRFFSLLWATGAFYLSWLWGKASISRTFANSLLFLMMISVPHVYYSIEIRMYSMTVFVALLLLLGYHYLDRDWRVQNLLFYATGIVFGLYTYHYLALLILVQHVFIILKYRRLKLKLLHLFTLDSICLIAAVPVFIRLFSQLGFVGSSYWGIPPDWRELPGLFFWFVGGPAWKGRPLLQLLVLTTWFVLFFLGWFSPYLNRTRRLYFFFLLSFPPVVIFFLSQKSPLFQSRYFLFLLPVFLYLTALGIELVSRRLNRFAVIIPVMITSLTLLFHIHSGVERIDMQSVFDTMATLDDRQDDVYHLGGTSLSQETYIISRYYNSGNRYEKIWGNPDEVGKEVRSILSREDFTADLRPEKNGSKFFWVIVPKQLQSTITPAELVLGAFGRNIGITRQWKFNGVFLFRCYRRAVPFHS